MAQFPIDIVEKAFVRQEGLCGLCGKELVWENYEYGDKGSWHAHHVDGENTNYSLSNCVCLCLNEPEFCHLKAHLGDFAGDTVLSKSSYTYWFG